MVDMVDIMVGMADITVGGMVDIVGGTMVDGGILGLQQSPFCRFITRPCG
jgi:hypothetical protein